MKSTLFALFALCSGAVMFGQTGKEPTPETPDSRAASQSTAAEDAATNPFKTLQEDTAVNGGPGAYAGSAGGDYGPGAGEAMESGIASGPPQPVKLDEASVAKALGAAGRVVLVVDDGTWYHHKLPISFDDTARKHLAVAILKSLKGNELQGDPIATLNYELHVRYSSKAHEQFGRFIPNVIVALEGPAKQRFEQHAVETTNLLLGTAADSTVNRRIELKQVDPDGLCKLLPQLIPGLTCETPGLNVVVVNGKSADVQAARDVIRSLDDPATGDDPEVHGSAVDPATGLIMTEPIGVRLLTTRLRNLQLQREKLLRHFGIHHPDVQEIESQILAVQAQQKANAELSLQYSARLASDEIAVTQTEYEQAERNAAQIAENLRTTRAARRDGQQIDTLKQELRDQVRSAFLLRMQLQQAQLSEAETKLTASRDRLARRRQIADEIIQRRVEELESGDDTSWLSSQGTSARPGSPLAAGPLGEGPLGEGLLTSPTSPTAGLPAPDGTSENSGDRRPGDVQGQETRAQRGETRPQPVLHPDGDSDALRLTYDDIDLLKILNIDTVPIDAAQQLPKWLQELHGRRIRIRGFMFPTFTATGLTQFALARDHGICCFDREPKICDIIAVRLAKGQTTDYIDNQPLDVEGIFRIAPEADDSELFQLYRIEDATVLH